MRGTAAVSAFVFVSALGLTACGDSKGPTAGADASLVATWDVRSIDGQALPITETEDLGDGFVCSFTLPAASITFSNNGRYAGNTTITFQCTGSPAQTFTEPSAGTWRVSGSTLFMTQDPDADGPFDEESSTFTISGNTLTITSLDDGTVIVLQRR